MRFVHKMLLGGLCCVALVATAMAAGPATNSSQTGFVARYLCVCPGTNCKPVPNTCWDYCTRCDDYCKKPRPCLQTPCPQYTCDQYQCKPRPCCYPQPLCPER